MVAILSPRDIQTNIAKRLKKVRLAADLTQQGLATRSGVSLGSLKRFEHDGEISLKSLVKLAFALRMEGELNELFQLRQETSLDSILNQAKTDGRQRGRKS